MLTLLWLATSAIVVYRKAMQVAFGFLARIGASVFKRTGRAIVSAVLALALLTASMHHLSCLGDGDGQAAAATVGVQQNAPQPADQDQCPPGHCHCVCHAKTDIRAEAVSVSVALADASYSARVPGLGHPYTVHPPFEPPCA